MSKKKPNITGDGISYTYTLDLSQNKVYFSDPMMNFYLDSSPITEYNKIDAKFDELEDQTSQAREILRSIGINCRD